MEWQGSDVICVPTFSGKEARKKELKKNKKQRLMVRQAVLKGKDPAQLLEEMEKIDEMGKLSKISAFRNGLMKDAFSGLLQSSTFTSHRH